MQASPHPALAPAEDGLLLHACCAPCSTVAVPFWRAEGLTLQAVFFNPNIQPQGEYDRRLESMEGYAAAVGLPLSVQAAPGEEVWGRAVGRAWLRGGAADDSAAWRCRACVALRLRETAWSAVSRGLARFSTSLTISPHQHHDEIVQAGLRAADEAGVEFVYADLRRHYRRSIEESRRLGLYRQHYCGCVASKWDAWLQRAARRRRRAA